MPKPARTSSRSKAARAVTGEGKTLVIAEKPSVSRDIAKALGGFENKKHYLEGPDFILTSAIGHLLELVPPEGAEVARGKWSLHNLPVIPHHFDLRPIAKSESQLKLIHKLYARKDVCGVINACDAGREGELIFHYLIRHFNGAKPVQRLWLRSMTPQAIRDGFASLRDGDALLPLQRAAVCRSESDWLIGINATRAMTALNSYGGGFSLTTVGRVQTPTLALLVDREKEIQTFDPRAYWEVTATFDIASGRYQGRWTDPQMQAAAKAAAAQAGGDKTGAAQTTGKDRHGTTKADRIWEQARADAIVAQCKNRDGRVSETTKPSTQHAPMLFDLTSLQREANRRFGFSARATLGIAQALYERHKALTYPRTDSRVLPEDYPETATAIMRALSTSTIDDDDAPTGGGETDAPIRHWAARALREQYINGRDKRIFDNARVSDHFAIIPTGETPRILKEQERRIYDLVTRSFIAAFYPAARFENTVRHTIVETQTFETRGRVLIEGGWLHVMGRKESGETLPPLAEADGDTERATTVDVTSEGRHTKPPPRYNEATLLSSMEGAGKLLEDDALREAMRGRGLGTPATRAAIIEELIRNRYLLRDARELAPTPKAMTLVRLLRALKIDDLTKAELTGEWEKKLKQIESDEFSSEDFMSRIRSMTDDIVVAARGCDVDNIDDQYAQLTAPCPKCGRAAVREKYRKFVCDACEFAIWKSIAGRELTPAEATTLLRDRRSGMLDGFRSRRGMEFSAELVITPDFTASFDFGDAAGDDAVDPDQCDQLGPCPKCGAPVLDTTRRYVCRNTLGEDAACDFKIGRYILSRPIEAGDVRQLLGRGKTDLLQGFVSKKNRRKFASHLTMDLHDKTGKLGFEFAPRKTDAADGTGGRPGRRRADTTDVVLDFTDAGVRVLNGRYGPYVTDGTTNVTIRDRQDPATLTLSACQALLRTAKSSSAPHKKTSKKKTTRKKTTQKKAPRKKAPQKKNTAGPSA